MNAAFAIGRLLDMNPGKERLLNLPDTEKMVNLVCDLIGHSESGYVLSTSCSSKFYFDRKIHHPILKLLFILK